MKIQKDFAYERQQEHIITWNDPEIEEEIAISFINLSASNEVW